MAPRVFPVRNSAPFPDDFPAPMRTRLDVTVSSLSQGTRPLGPRTAPHQRNDVLATLLEQGLSTPELSHAELFDAVWDAHITGRRKLSAEDWAARQGAEGAKAFEVDLSVWVPPGALEGLSATSDGWTAEHPAGR